MAYEEEHGVSAAVAGAVASVLMLLIHVMAERSDRCRECGEKMPPIVADFSYLCGPCAVTDEWLLQEVRADRL